MKTQVIFRDFEGFDHLKAFVADALDHTIGKLNIENIQEIKVIIGKDHARHLGRPPTFVCEALLNARNRTYFAKKNDADFNLSVRKCVRALAKKFINSTRNRRDQKRSFDRHQIAYEFNEIGMELLEPA